jgi:hypothetical protein
VRCAAPYHASSSSSLGSFDHHGVKQENSLVRGQYFFNNIIKIS